MAGLATLRAWGGGGRARPLSLPIGGVLRVLVNAYACRMVLAAIDGIPDHDLERGGTSRQALRRDVIAYFRELQMDPERMSCWR
jgi:hypothetical protein